MTKINFPPYAEVQELKNETQSVVGDQIPSFEEFIENYKGDKLVENSYQVEHEAKIIHGSQYGPGRSDFSGLCRRIKNELGDNLTCRITCDSDNFYS